MSNNFINVEVVYASPQQQILLKIQLEEGSCVKDAIQSSGILSHLPNGELGELKVGIFSQQCSLETKLKAGDRIEIYRPLVIDPKQARLKRVVKKK